MKYVKIALSFIAAFLLAAAGVLLGGQNSAHNQETVSLLQAMAGALAIVGFTPAVVSLQVGKTLAAVSLVVSLFLGGHWLFLVNLESIHPGVVTALHVIGFVNAVVAFFARTQAAPAPAVAPPAGPKAI